MESFAGLTKELSSLRWRDLLRQIQQREPERVEQNQRRQEHWKSHSWQSHADPSILESQLEFDPQLYSSP